MERRLTAETPDGRVLDVYVDGPESGTPLLFHSGTPSSGTLYAPFVEEASRRGLRLASFSRAGYGGSTRNPGRRVGDVAADVAAVLDRLGEGRFYTLGWSGGGPHALACAALLPTRLVGAATVGGLAPFAAPGLDWFGGMGEDNVTGFRAALDGDAALRAILERIGPAFASVAADEIAARLGSLVADVDRPAITGGAAAWLAANFRESVRVGLWGWHDDQLAFVRPWGFSLGDIRVPVAIWQGLQDRQTPYAHGEWLSSHIPGVHPHLLAGEGHLSLGVDSFGRILDDLLTLGPA